MQQDATVILVTNSIIVLYAEPYTTAFKGEMKIKRERKTITFVILITHYKWNDFDLVFTCTVKNDFYTFSNPPLKIK